VEPVDALLERQVVSEDPRIQVTARAEAAEQPAAGDVVDGHQLAEEQVGVPVVRRADEGAQLDPGRHGGGGRQGGQRAEPR
jgi:hypothetical protein